jgi:hypothetical protein
MGKIRLENSHKVKKTFVFDFLQNLFDFFTD